AATPRRASPPAWHRPPTGPAPPTRTIDDLFPRPLWAGGSGGGVSRREARDESGVRHQVPHGKFAGALPRGDPAPFFPRPQGAGECIVVCRCSASGRTAMSEDAKPSGPDLAAGIPFADLADGAMLQGHVGADPVLLARRCGEIFAVGALCTHYHGALADGLMVGDTVRCPLHHA